METINTLLGMTFTSVCATDDEIIFISDTGRTFELYHDQDCCESVYIEDIVGDLNDLVGSELLRAEEVTSDDFEDVSEDWGSHTWTFYKFATRKGYVDIRWHGESNGWYSESVYFREVL